MRALTELEQLAARERAELMHWARELSWALHGNIFRQGIGDHESNSEWQYYRHFDERLD